MFPGPEPGQAAADTTRGHYRLQNNVLAMSWTLGRRVLAPEHLLDRINGKRMELGGDLFSIHLADGRRIRSSHMRVLGLPQVSNLTAEPRTVLAARRFRGKQITAYLEDAVGDVAVEWRAELRDGANYIRQVVTLKSRRSDLAISDLVLMDLAVDGARQVGSVDGSPVVAEQFFFGCEHPMAKNTAGYATRPVGVWSPDDVSFPERTNLRWEITELVEGPGTYEVRFEYTEGDHRLEIFRLALLAGGTEVAVDHHFGATGISNVDNRYRLDIAHHDPCAVYALVADVRSDGGTDSHGSVTLAYRAGMPRVRAMLPYNSLLPARQLLQLSSVTGVVPAGQLRRGFLHYVERERAHPYRPFLHYNSWYDIGYFSKFKEADCLRVVDAFGSELVEKRGTKLDSFLFDDGWDDHESLWNFHEGLPNGFAPIRQATNHYGAAPGVWLSPWGGYGDPRKKRLASGQEAGYEINEKGFVLSAPKYYKRFREICLEMLREYGVNQFKFDGIGRAGGRFPGSAFGSDFQAAIQLISDLRGARPDVYINLTTGTWPSPFWLRHADSIWRGGYDHEFTGVGSDRQQWITYRDATTYQNVVKGGPLFPLSSLMLHGVIYAKHARQLNTDPHNDLRDEIRTAFGCGTQLQELYISPELLTERNWDDLAAAAHWARANATVLRDTHWVGGDPAKLEVYGWASWARNKGILVLRNPSDSGQVIDIDIGDAFELPSGARREYRLTSPYEGQRVENLHLIAGTKHTFTLQPFEVLVFDAGR